MEKWIKHPLIKDQKIESRLYQQVLAADVLKTGNTMIVAPTALGKTIVAVLVAAERLKHFKGSKVLVLAPSKPLVVQHEESFREFMNVSATSLTGDIKPEERAKRWDEYQIICATPQTIESDLISSRYDLKDVKLLVFDECHRGVGSYSYVYLASKYQKDSDDPLVLGLTASPGSGEDKINEVCDNLFINDVIIKSEDDNDVVPYFNPVEVKWIKIELNEELKEIKKSIDATLKARFDTLKRMGVIKSVNMNKKDVLMAKGAAQNRIAKSSNPPKKCYLAVSTLTAVINAMHALELLETQGIRTLNLYFDRLRKKRTKAAKSLLMDENFKKAISLTKIAHDKEIEHPKLAKLVSVLKKELKENKDSRIIVFTQFRDTVDRIYDECVEYDINAVKFFGQASKEGTKGLTQKKQKEVIKAFKMGTYDVLISTSVAEEGIDIPAVDLVILYEPVPSEIRMIQRRGRTGRKNKGKMYILITKGTRDEAYYWSSINKERNMKRQLSKRIKRNIAPKEDVKVIPREGETAQEVKPVIYADSREGNSKVLRELDKLDVDIKVRGLAVADYQVSDEVAIERKTVSDFIGSIIDKRLYKQARELVENFRKPVIIIEGENLYSSLIHPNAIRGAMASLAVDFGIPIIPTRSEEDTAAMITRIAIREQIHERTDIQIRTEKKPLTLYEQQLYIVESLPNIGPVTAKKLLEEFGSVKGVVNASESELKKVEGIGNKIAQKIREVVSSGFGEIKVSKTRKLTEIDEKSK
ncbi:DEAD/DEAH box helicase [Methanobacterium sp. ACI-7]|uniref:DEAD/DEAH box helicase n=1 Tax=unclassified Methanobacterium TaxID=2627676 RepID=UPI0039C2191F